MRNFLSVGNVTTAVHLDKTGLTLVLGDNKDATSALGISRNGVGKTTLIQAISYAIYGWPISKIKQDNLINNINQKNMMVSIDFEKNDILYRIERGRKPNILRFFVNGTEQDFTDDEAQGDNRHTQEEIDRIIGMSYTLFKHLVALNTHTDPFLKMKVADQREVIEELIAVSQISQRATVLKANITTTKDIIKDLQAHIKAKTETNTRIRASIDTLVNNKATWEEQHANRLSLIEKQMSTFALVDFDSEILAFEEFEKWLTDERILEQERTNITRDISAKKREIDMLNTQVSALALNTNVTTQVSRLEAEILRKRKDIERIDRDIEAKSSFYAIQTDNLANSDGQICVCCNQSLKDTDHLQTVIANMKAEIVKTEADLIALDAKKTAIETEIATIEAEIQTVKQHAEDLKTENEAKKLDLQNKIIEKSNDLSDFTDALNEIKEAIEAMGSAPATNYQSKSEIYDAKQKFDNLSKDHEVERDKVNPYTFQIESLTNTIQEIDYEELNDAVNLSKHQDFLLKLLTSKESFIRKKIIDQNLHHLNSRMAYYLEKLGLPHQVKFLSDLSVEISLVGRDYDFEQLSRGEMNRVIMATSWSFRDVWEAMNNRINLMFVDEMLDQGTDTSGVEAALAILRGMAREGKKAIFLISHKDDLAGRINQILMVRKENDFTTFEEDVIV